MVMSHDFPQDLPPGDSGFLLRRATHRSDLGVIKHGWDGWDISELNILSGKLT